MPFCDLMTSGYEGTHLKGKMFGRYVRQASASESTPARTIKTLAASLGRGDFDFILLFFSPEYRTGAFLEEIGRTWPNETVVGCSSAGEISQAGYVENHVIALGFPKAHFHAAHRMIYPLDQVETAQLHETVLKAKQNINEAQSEWPGDFALLLCDGLSLQEDRLAARLGAQLQEVSLLGGSAGDGLSFEETVVLFEGQFHSNAALFSLVRTRCSVRAFRFDHFLPGEKRMVVTGADPENRLVHEINAEPAATEYARLVGKEHQQLSPFIFAAHPVMVRVGGEYHVRAIQKVEANGSLRFFSAIDEGLVLTLAHPRDIVTHLDEVMAHLREQRCPDTILAFDCVLRRLEAEQKQLLHKLSNSFSQNGVIGFSTYGEQYNMLHVNQTLTGVAIYPPEDVQNPENCQGKQQESFSH